MQRWEFRCCLLTDVSSRFAQDFKGIDCKGSDLQQTRKRRRHERSCSQCLCAEEFLRFVWQFSGANSWNSRPNSNSWRRRNRGLMMQTAFIERTSFCGSVWVFFLRFIFAQSVVKKCQIANGKTAKHFGVCRHLFFVSALGDFYESLRCDVKRNKIRTVKTVSSWRLSLQSVSFKWDFCRNESYFSQNEE